MVVQVALEAMELVLPNLVVLEAAVVVVLQEPLLVRKEHLGRAMPEVRDNLELSLKAAVAVLELLD